MYLKYMYVHAVSLWNKFSKFINTKFLPSFLDVRVLYVFLKSDLNTFETISYKRVICMKNYYC